MQLEAEDWSLEASGRLVLHGETVSRFWVHPSRSAHPSAAVKRETPTFWRYLRLKSLLEGIGLSRESRRREGLELSIGKVVSCWCLWVHMVGVAGWAGLWTKRHVSCLHPGKLLTYSLVKHGRVRTGNWPLGEMCVRGYLGEVKL